MEIVGKKLTIKEFQEYVKAKDFGSIPPSMLVLHHTWKPTVTDWKGESTIQGLKRYYEGKGWSAAPHIFIAPDGIWLFTDMYKVGIHAGNGNAGWRTKDGRYWEGWGNDFKNNKLQWYSIGIEVVGNYDEKRWSDDMEEKVRGVMNALRETLKIEEKNIRFHRDFSGKTCPGAKITKPYVMSVLNEEEEKLEEGAKHFLLPINNNLREAFDLLGILDGHDNLDLQDRDILANAIKDEARKAKALAQMASEYAQKLDAIKKIIK